MFIPAVLDIKDACSQFRGKVIVPAVQGKVSGEHVLVMEWVDSLGPASDSNSLKKAGLRPVDVMRTATEVFGYQIFSTGHVHCDPHPGNLLVRLAPAESSEKWQLVLLDHGLYCELSPALRRDYADFWVAAALGDTASTVRICSQWGIADQDAAELFASLTQFRRVRLGAQRLDAMASLFGSRGNKKADVMPHAPKKLTAKAMAEAQQKLKARAKKVLGDTAAFPRELLFVGRSLNMIRSANFALGTAVNRVAILAECAAAGAALQGGSLASRRLAVWNFHFRVQSLLFLSKLFQLWQSLSSLGLAPAVLGLTGLFLRVSQQKPWSHKAFLARRPEAEVSIEQLPLPIILAGFYASMRRLLGRAALEEDMLSAMVARIMAWYPSYVITLIFLCVVFFSYSAWDWTSFMAHVFLISGSFQEHREAVFPYLPCSWWFTCLAAYTLAWLPMHNILKLSSDSVIWTMFVMATAVVVPSVLLQWLFFKDMAIFEMIQYSFAFFYGQALAVWQVNHCMLLQVQTAAPSRQLRILQILGSHDTGSYFPDIATESNREDVAGSHPSPSDGGSYSQGWSPLWSQQQKACLADLQSTVLDWPDGSAGLQQTSDALPKNELARSRKSNKGKSPAKKTAVPRYDARGHRLRHRKDAKPKRPVPQDGNTEARGPEGSKPPGPEEATAQVDGYSRNGPRPPRVSAPRAPAAGKPASALLSMARSPKSFSPPKRAANMSSAKLEPLQTEKEPPLPLSSLAQHMDVRSRPPSHSSLGHGSGLARAASAVSVGPLRRDIPDKKFQVADLAMRDLRADLSTMLKRSAAKVHSLDQPPSAPRSVDDVFASQVAKFQEPLATKRAAQPVLREIDSTAASVQEDDFEEAFFGEEPPALAETAAAGTAAMALGPASPVASELMSPVADKQKMKSALRRNSRGSARVSWEQLPSEETRCQSASLSVEAENIKQSFEPTLRKRLGEAFSRLSEANELHRDSMHKAVEFAGWTVTAEVKALINEAYDSLFKYNTLNQREFFHFFEKFRHLEKQRAFEPRMLSACIALPSWNTSRHAPLHLFFEAFNTFDADASGTIDFEELGALLESQGIFPLQHVIYELAMDACGGNLVDGLDFSEFQRVLEILREREGFTREEIERIEDAFDKCDADGSGHLP
eukprot:s2950_g5.t1